MCNVLKIRVLDIEVGGVGKMEVEGVRVNISSPAYT